MKIKFIFLTVFTLCFALTAFSNGNKPTIIPSKNITKITKEFKDFTKIEVEEDLNVFITFSDTDEGVTVETNENLQDKIVVEQNGKTLHVRFKSNLRVVGNIVANIYITAKTIDTFVAKEDCIIQLENPLIQDVVHIDLDEDSELRGTIQAKVLNLDLREDSVVEFSGTADEVNAELKEDSILSGYDFIVKSLKAELKEDSEVKLTVTESLRVHAYGDSELSYKGNPAISGKRVWGDSELIKVN